MSAVSPAAAGDAMLVPLKLTWLQLLELILLSLFAELMFWPGITISGLIRPSSVGPQLLKLAIDPALVACCVAPTETALFAVDGLPTLAMPGPELPAAKKRRKSLWFHMNSSTSWQAVV